VTSPLFTPFTLNRLTVPNRWVMLALGWLLLASCDAASNSVSDTTSMVDEVRAFEAEVFSAYNADDAARAARNYAKDAFVFIPGQPETHGREAIAANIARFMADPNFKLGYTNQQTRVAASHDLAEARGELRVTYTDSRTGSARTTTSHYLLVMQKQSDAGWQVVEDISF